MDKEKVNIIYVGPWPGVSIDKLGIYNQKKGVPFLVPQWFADEKLKLEPDKWKLADVKKPERSAAEVTKAMAKKGGETDA